MGKEEYLEKYHVFVKFLRYRKDDGTSATEESALPYARMDKDDYTIDDYDEYYYSLS